MGSIKRLRFKPDSTWLRHVRKGHAAGRSWKRSCAGRMKAGERNKLEAQASARQADALRGQIDGFLGAIRNVEVDDRAR